MQGAAATKAYRFHGGLDADDRDSGERVDGAQILQQPGRRPRHPAPGRHRPGLYPATPRARRSSSARAGSATRRWARRSRIRTGEAFDVKVKSAVTKREKITQDEWERSARYRITDGRDGTRIVEVETNPVFNRTTMTYTLTNARPTPVGRRARPDRPRQSAGTTRGSSRNRSAASRSRINDRLYRVTVPANGETVVTATFDTRY